MQTEGQVSLFGPDSPFGKTFPEPFPAAKGRTSRPCSKPFVKSGGAQTILYLSLRKGSGFLPETLWETVSLLPGACWTPQAGAYPKEERESFLWQILQENAPEKYFLTKTACMGILRRAKKRGKELPLMLKEALEEVVGGGSIQCLNPWDCESKRLYEVGGVYRTLDAGNGAGGQAHGVCCNPAAFMGGQGAKAGSIAYADDGSTPTLKSAPSGGNTVPDVVYPINTMVATRGGKDDGRTAFGVGEANGPAREHAVCYAIEGNVADREAKQNGMGVSRDQCPTLNGQDRHAVCFQQNQREEVRDMGGASGALSAEPGSHQQNYVCYKQSGFADYEEGVGTLKASGGDVGGGRKASLLSAYDGRGRGDGKIVPTMCSDHNGRPSDYTCLVLERLKNG